MRTKLGLWERFKDCCVNCPSIELALDISRVNFPDDFFARMEPRLQQAYAEMTALEQGAIANRDENRMVGHYWLRNSALAPTPEIGRAIEETLTAVKTFARDVHTGRIAGAAGNFKNLLVIGIGGSALGPQFAASALGHPKRDKMRMFFFDNTDPDGMDRVQAQLEGELGHTLTLVISKSGGTQETRNGMLEAEAAYRAAGLDFGRHAVAVTGDESGLDQFALKHGWLRRFQMWDWIGGRTSEMSVVGLLPAALQGINIDDLLSGARACDEITRGRETRANPAAQLALMWYFLGEGRGTKDMVVLPYKDRLELFSKYLQQLVMESLGKELDRDNKTVNQGLAVYGNKGSTDQHAYVQQLRDGVPNFFVVFIEVLREREGRLREVELGVTAGDYLSGFLLGTREALYSQNRQSVTITVREVAPFNVGVLIALFERAVGIYAALVNINAYHQPGVEAGKKAAVAVIELQKRVVTFLTEAKGKCFTAELIAERIGNAESAETVFRICEHLAANPDKQIFKSESSNWFNCAYGYRAPAA